MLSGIIFLVFLTIFITGEPSLLIYKTVNGTNQPITAAVKVVTGNNLTLNCRDVTSTQNEVSWSRKSQLRSYVVGSKDSISFTPAKITDHGVYICTNVKRNESQPVSVMVYDSNRRLKRTRYDLDQLFKATFDLGTVTSDPVGEVLRNNKPMLRPTVHPSWFEKNSISNFNVDESENWPNYVRPGNSWGPYYAGGDVPSNDLFDKLYNKKTEDKIMEYPDVPVGNGNNQYTLLYCMVIFGGLLLFGGIMCMCVRNNPNVRAHIDRASSLNPACTHAMCVRHRDTNPLAGCILSTLNPTNRIPTPMVHTNEDGDVTVLTFPNENIDSIDFDDIPDTPPSYSNTVDDIKSDLPPSYEEVLQNMLPPSYSSYQSTSTAINASVSQRNAPLVNDV